MIYQNAPAAERKYVEPKSTDERRKDRRRIPTPHRSKLGLDVGLVGARARAGKELEEEKRPRSGRPAADVAMGLRDITCRNIKGGIVRTRTCGPPMWCLHAPNPRAHASDRRPTMENKRFKEVKRKKEKKKKKEKRTPSRILPTT